MTELLNPKLSENAIFCVIFVVYLGHGHFHPVAVFFSLETAFGREALTKFPMTGTQKSRVASLS